MAESKKGAILILAALATVLFDMCLFSNGWASNTVIKRIRSGSEKNYVRVVIETDTRLESRPQISTIDNLLQISLSGIKKEDSILESEAYRDDVVSMEISGTSSNTRIDARLTFIPTRIETFALTAPYRLVIDAYRPIIRASGKSPAKDTQAKSIIGKNGGPPSNTIPEETALYEKKRRASAVSKSEPTAVTSAGSKAAGQKGFQQRLLVFLILVTSIILLAIILLMCLDRKQK